ncbi:hypothetical protein Tco_1351950 [Tanacetum coccineum]
MGCLYDDDDGGGVACVGGMVMVAAAAAAADGGGVVDDGAWRQWERDRIDRLWGGFLVLAGKARRKTFPAVVVVVAGGGGESLVSAICNVRSLITDEAKGCKYPIYLAVFISFKGSCITYWIRLYQLGPLRDPTTTTITTITITNGDGMQRFEGHFEETIFQIKFNTGGARERMLDAIDADYSTQSLVR